MAHLGASLMKASANLVSMVVESKSNDCNEDVVEDEFDLVLLVKEFSVISSDCWV